MSATQPIDTTGTNIATDLTAQTIANIELDDLLEHIAKKVKASTSNDENVLTSSEPSPTNRGPIYSNDERPETPKNLEFVPYSKKIIIPPRDSYITDLPNMKFSHNNPYLVIALKLDFYNDQCTTMQQNDLIQNAQNIKEQVKEITINKTYTKMEQRKAVLEDKSIYFKFETTESSSQKKEDDTISITSNTYQQRMDMDEISNAIVEGTKILHQLYSLVVTNKNYIIASME
ncbi:42655_t:CDS:2 [Gigaspora margarita]|uniref:42655_t:CDS:1 n=1 Tax=Gigaspora margarita TaxID=4874 RepID=A0ABN7V9L9_GIGMA|nr:42655_t:CDS:2 [Gigaspora margarita]